MTSCSDDDLSCGAALIVNADDWGRDRGTTDKTLECAQAGAISSVSAMVFMHDSLRAASLARGNRLNAGLHLNFTTAFSASPVPSRLQEHQMRISSYLKSNRFAQTVFNPLLVRAFDYVIKAQHEEFARIYGAEPERFDGHHHMHLCANVLLGNSIPAGTVVRRSLTFSPGQKSRINQVYRQTVDRKLKRRHRTVDFLFSLPPLAPKERLERIFDLARNAIVEVETHPVNPDEHRFLVSGELLEQLQDVRVSPEHRVRGIA